MNKPKKLHFYIKALIPIFLIIELIVFILWYKPFPNSIVFCLILFIFALLIFVIGIQERLQQFILKYKLKNFLKKYRRQKQMNQLIEQLQSDVIKNIENNFNTVEDPNKKEQLKGTKDNLVKKLNDNQKNFPILKESVVFKELKQKYSELKKYNIQKTNDILNICRNVDTVSFLSVNSKDIDTQASEMLKDIFKDKVKKSYKNKEKD
ncbi:hypothetical protein [Mycoplasma sp. 3686d]|uniref:hypothetical protein n=1 Tax=Mycoplasma sp. 3686d TaxID=2967300 RepID=UPI00211C311E|nr:hypothetical protein [Mycoplasma sp. 3686d]UUM24573.1 hypothetical protein NPA12_02625 [Mycoplasma sp. 3686d]